MIVVRHQPDSGRVADGDPRRLGFTEIADRIPVMGLDQGEQWAPFGGIGARGNRKADHQAIKGRAKRSVANVQLGEANVGLRTGQLSLQACGVANLLARLFGLLNRRSHSGLRDLLVGLCFIDLLHRNVTLVEQRREPADRVLRVAELRACPSDLGGCGIGAGGLPRHLTRRQVDLRLQGYHLSARPAQLEIKWLGVDLNQYIALGDPLVVLDAQRYNSPTDIRRQTNVVGEQ